MATSGHEDVSDPGSPATKQCKRLIIRRNGILGSAKLIGAFNENYNPDTDYAQFKFRLQKLDTLWTEFNEVQAEIELEYGLSEELSEGKATFEDMYYRLKGSLDSKLGLSNSPSTIVAKYLTLCCSTYPRIRRSAPRTQNSRVQGRFR